MNGVRSRSHDIDMACEGKGNTTKAWFQKVKVTPQRHDVRRSMSKLISML